jgi:uncharacterized SAM-binding protein YcdF (DUF218 family)
MLEAAGTNSHPHETQLHRVRLMSILFDKVFALVVYPLGLSILLLLIGIALGLAARRIASTLLILCAVVVLWVFSTPLVSRMMLSSLEKTNSLETISSADVAILLGGLMRGQNQQKDPDLTDAADRAVQAFRLYRSGRVRHILITGGNLPWSLDSVPEAQHIAGLLREWGIPDQAIITESKSRNTWENATNSRPIWEDHGFKTGLLVTSATHMPRALAVFRRAGFRVAPAATDFRAQPLLEGGILALLPDAQALADSTVAFKEWIGLLVYRIRGWS